jgi:hypothetical protein
VIPSGDMWLIVVSSSVSSDHVYEHPRGAGQRVAGKIRSSWIPGSVGTTSQLYVSGWAPASVRLRYLRIACCAVPVPCPVVLCALALGATLCAPDSGVTASGAVGAYIASSNGWATV